MKETVGVIVNVLEVQINEVDYFVVGRLGCQSH